MFIFSDFVNKPAQYKDRFIERTNNTYVNSLSTITILLYSTVLATVSLWHSLVVEASPNSDLKH